MDYADVPTLERDDDDDDASKPSIPRDTTTPVPACGAALDSATTPLEELPRYKEIVARRETARTEAAAVQSEIQRLENKLARLNGADVACTDELIELRLERVGEAFCLTPHGLLELLSFDELWRVVGATYAGAFEGGECARTTCANEWCDTRERSHVELLHFEDVTHELCLVLCQPCWKHRTLRVCAARAHAYWAAHGAEDARRNWLAEPFCRVAVTRATDKYLSLGQWSLLLTNIIDPALIEQQRLARAQRVLPRGGGEGEQRAAEHHAHDIDDAVNEYLLNAALLNSMTIS